MNRKYKRKHRLRTILLALAVGTLLAAFMPEITAKNGILERLGGLLGIGGKHEVQLADGGPGLTVRVFDVGEGLAVLLESQGEYMLFDGGGRETSSRYINDLRDAGVDKVKYLAASHFDEDHLAGLVGALRNYKVEHVLAPSYDAGTWIYRSFVDAVSEDGLNIETPQRGSTYELGNCTVTCLSTPGEYHEEENDYSLVMRVVCGDRSIMLTGDATWVTEQDILHTGLKVKSDILVVGHHGSSSSSDREFLQAVSPETAVISVGADNDYGHPAQSVLDRLEEEYIHLLRTDNQGDLTMRTDGTYWSYDPQPTDDYTRQAMPLRNGMKPVTDAGADPETERVVSAETTYVLNNSKMKFHKPTCGSVKKISENNYGETTESRDALIAEGYTPCGTCKP